MSELIVVTYDDVFQAEEVRLKLLKMQQDYLIDLEDAVVAIKDKDGKIKLRQMYSPTATGAMHGGFWGILVGLLFLNPLMGLVVGSASGAVAGVLTDVGINDDFMKKLAANLDDGKSTLFVLARKVVLDKLIDELEGSGGKVIHTSLTHEDEKKLQEAMESAQAEQNAK